MGTRQLAELPSARHGISMELYGKGFVLGPDAGIGQHLYSGADYNEYYARFPAHNTVCVDGASDHAVMMSQHPFEVKTLSPLPRNGERVFMTMWMQGCPDREVFRALSPVKTKMKYGGIKVNASYAVISDGKTLIISK